MSAANLFAGLLGCAPQIVRLEVELDGLSPGLSGLRLVFVTDVHASWMFPRRSVCQLVALLEALRPDLVLLGGDYGESRARTHALFEALGALRPPLGMVGVMGNNDAERFPGPTEGELRRLMARAGAELLVNQRVLVRASGGMIVVGGVGEAKYHGRTAHGLFRDCRSGDARLLLSHYPQGIRRILGRVKGPKPQLALCGHTHGGQINLFGLSPYSLGYEGKYLVGGERPMVGGLYRVEETQVLVSAGLGASRLPLRIGAPPQLHLIELKRKNAAELPKFG